MQHDSEGNECLQVHKRRRDVEQEIQANRVSVARENEGDLAPQDRQDVGMPVEAFATDNEGRAHLRPRAEGRRGQKHDMQDVLET